MITSKVSLELKLWCGQTFNYEKYENSLWHHYLNNKNTFCSIICNPLVWWEYLWLLQFLIRHLITITKRVLQQSATVCQKHGVQEDKKCFEKESKDHRIYPLPSLVDSVHQFLFNWRNPELLARRHNP